MHSDILAELYRQYYSSALLYVLSLCRDRALAEEIVHDAFAKAYLSLPDDVPSFPFWLMKVCRNLFYDHARRQKFLTDAPVPEGTNLNSPETLLLQNEGAAALWRAIANWTRQIGNFWRCRPIIRSRSGSGLRRWRGR